MDIYLKDIVNGSEEFAELIDKSGRYSITAVDFRKWVKNSTEYIIELEKDNKEKRKAGLTLIEENKRLTEELNKANKRLFGGELKGYEIKCPNCGV